MLFFADSIDGKVRQNNEDTIALITKHNYHVAIVADGMGGATSGEVASRTAVSSISDFFDINERRDIDQLFLADAIQHANDDVLSLIKNDPSLKGMGSTLTLCCFDNEGIIAAQIGDSSAYLYNTIEKKLIKITKDHSYVQKLIDFGKMTDDEAKRSPFKNIITRAIGVKNVRSDYDSSKWAANDILMMFSDGLTNSLTNGEILSIVSSSGSLTEKGSKLIADALEKGGNDNISVILAENADGGESDER